MRRMLLGLVFFAVLAWLAYQWSDRAAAPVPAGAGADSVVGGFRTVKLYFASPDADSLVVETREVQEPANLHRAVATLVEELDRGPREGSVAALPAGTSVLNVYRSDRGVLTVDLSRAFLQGFRGGSSAEYLAIATLVRTLGANMPDIQSVQLVVGGSPLQSLGGHLPLDRPLDVNGWNVGVAR